MGTSRYDSQLDVTLHRGPGGKRGNQLVRTPHIRVPWPLYIAGMAVKVTWTVIRLAVRHPKATLGALLLAGAWWTVAGAAAVYGWLLVGPLTLTVTVLALAAGRRHLADTEGGTRPRPPLRAVARAALVYRRDWRAAMKGAGLTTQDRGQERLPTLLSVTTDDGRDVIRLRMLPGQTPGDYSKVAERIAQTFDAREVRVRTVPRRAHLLDLMVITVDVLDHPVRPVSTGHVDLEAIEVGMREDGSPFHLRVLYSHLLVAGLTGSGKGSVIWSLLLGLAPAVRSGHVKILAIDPKGGMELAAGQPLFHGFIHGPPEEIAEALDSAVAGMQRRADRLRGVTRKLVPTPADPLIVIVVDEIASLTAYVQDASLRRRIGNALSMLLSQGRAVGYSVICATQDARKETLGMRDLFPSRVALRTAEAGQVDLILGQGARDRGARADAISEHTPGVGYCVLDDMPEPVRVRFAHVTDARIERACGRAGQDA